MKKYKNLTITDTNGADCLIVDPRRFGDARGFFESVTIDELNYLGFTKFNQEKNANNKMVIEDVQVKIYKENIIVKIINGIKKLFNK